MSNIKFSFRKKLEAMDLKKYGQITLITGQDSRILVGPDGHKKIEIGIGEKNNLSHRKFFVIARQVVALAKTNKIKNIAFAFSDFAFPDIPLTPRERAEVLAIQFGMANFEFVKYKTPPPEGWNFVEEILVIGATDAAVRHGFKRGTLIASEINASRTLANTPGGEMTPKVLAEEAVKSVRGTKANVTIFGKSEIKKLGMGGIIGVSQGSSEEPRFIIVEYFDGPNKKAPVVLVGKGVTFDTGGLNLKPETGILDMHMDMSGGAAVIHAVALAAKLRLKKNIVGLIPAVENMPSGSSYRPGDILRTMSGKTIEVLNTDAEGRIILADALTYAKKYNPRLVVDVATLTGAAMVALGQRASALFTKDELLSKKIRQLGEASGDYVWPLPLWDEYEEEIKGTFGDIANLGKTRYGGAITGAMFLYQFAKDFPWVHIDIAPRMTSIEGEYLAKGSIGAPINLLLKIIEQI